jgi:hypothetical protein
MRYNHLVIFLGLVLIAVAIFLGLYNTQHQLKSLRRALDCYLPAIRYQLERMNKKDTEDSNKYKLLNFRYRDYFSIEYSRKGIDIASIRVDKKLIKSIWSGPEIPWLCVWIKSTSHKDGYEEIFFTRKMTKEQLLQIIKQIDRLKENNR